MKFQNTFCSQCGEEFGPGDHGYSHCRHHNVKTHLSYSQNGWSLIHQGSPLCDYKKTKAEVMEVVKFYKITLPDCTWNGDRGEFVITETIEETP